MPNPAAMTAVDLGCGDGTVCRDLVPPPAGVAPNRRPGTPAQVPGPTFEACANLFGI